MDLHWVLRMGLTMDLDGGQIIVLDRFRLALFLLFLLRRLGLMLLVIAPLGRHALGRLIVFLAELYVIAFLRHYHFHRRRDILLDVQNHRIGSGRGCWEKRKVNVNDIVIDFVLLIKSSIPPTKST